jgi:hypothetical protein
MVLKKTAKRKPTAKKATTKRKVAKKSNTKPAAKATKKTKYSPLAGKEVEKEMRKFKEGTATSGKAETPVESREQAIAIGLSKARKKGAKVPKKRK